MDEKSGIISIIAKLIFLSSAGLFLFFFLFSRPSEAADLYVSGIGSNPSSPVYNQKFECWIGVSFDEPNLACGLRPAGSSPNTKPWDICPKRNDQGLGRQLTENNLVHYNCIANSSTSVPGPGTYTLVAWRFSQDGAVGNDMATKNITILNTAPTPTNTPVPLPSPTHAPLPSATPVPSSAPTSSVISSPYPSAHPTTSYTNPNPTSSNVYPTSAYPTVLQAAPTTKLFIDQQPTSSVPVPSTMVMSGTNASPTPGQNNSAYPNPFFPQIDFTQMLSGVRENADRGVTAGKNTVQKGIGYVWKIFDNFLKETDF